MDMERDGFRLVGCACLWVVEKCDSARQDCLAAIYGLTAVTEGTALDFPTAFG